MESSQTTRKRRTTATVTPSKRTRASDDKHHKNLLQKITVKDFMCHAKLDMEFGERVNFIVGQNGAGKSAILNALQVSLVKIKFLNNTKHKGRLWRRSKSHQSQEGVRVDSNG